MLTFHIYAVDANGVSEKDSIRLNPNDINDLTKVKELRKLFNDRNHYVQPAGIEEIKFLVKKRKRGRAPLEDAVVLFIFEQFAQENKSFSQIRYEIFRRYNMEISRDYLIRLFKGQSYEHVDVPEKLRSNAKERLPKPKKRKTKITDDMKQEWVLLHEEEGLSGNEISKRYGISSASVNAHLRSIFGRRRDY